MCSENDIESSMQLVVALLWVISLVCLEVGFSTGVEAVRIFILLWVGNIKRTHLRHGRGNMQHVSALYWFGKMALGQAEHTF